MNYYEAHRLLNEVKEGKTHPIADIRFALYLTGDLDSPPGVRSEILDSPVSRNQKREWERQSRELVERYSRKHLED